MSKSAPRKTPPTPKKKAPSKKTATAIKDFVTWFEIPANDFERARNFYNHIYQIEMKATEVNGYSMAIFPHSTGVGGAVISGEGSVPSNRGPLIYLNAGNDMEGMLTRIADGGGTVIMGKTFINEDSGHFALFMDTEGNKLALHQK